MVLGAWAAHCACTVHCTGLRAWRCVGLDRILELDLMLDKSTESIDRNRISDNSLSIEENNVTLEVVDERCP